MPLIRIDDLHLPGCDFIKADVEGMELDVLRGAVKTIRRYRPILYLENDRLEKQPRLLTYVGSLGYEIWEHLPPLYNSNNYFKNKINVFGDIVSANIFCIPKEKEVKFRPGDFAMRRIGDRTLRSPGQISPDTTS